MREYIVRIRKDIEQSEEEPSKREASVTAAVIPREDGKVNVGFAFQSPRDQLNKKIGRDIARGRALKGHGEVVTPPDNPTTEWAHTMVGILLDLRRVGSVHEPRWLDRFVKEL